MSTADVPALKKALITAGFEIYRYEGSEIQLAERVRLHIMDSGVRVRAGSALVVEFTARSQKSDFPHAAPDDLFDRVRATVGGPAHAHGFSEKAFVTVEVKDPVNEKRVLDVWHEVTYAKSAENLESIVDEVRWALGVEKYVSG